MQRLLAAPKPRLPKKSAFVVKYLIAATLASLVSSLGHAMCIATTEHLFRVEVYTCQKVKIYAGRSRPGAHAIHRRGSSISGALVTGFVHESTIVWHGRHPSEAEYTFTTREIREDESITFFIDGDASQICAAVLGETNPFVTDSQCCDVLPARGLCLVPSTMIIAKEEKAPERWKKWTLPPNNPPKQRVKK